MAQPRSLPLFFISVTTFFNATARKGIIAELKAEKPPVATKKKAKKIDNQLKKIGIMLVAITLISAFIEEGDKKKSRGVTGAARVIQPGFNTVHRPDKQRAIRR
ncbi:hypothetical protein AAA69_003548 [Salmonella enterica subsp. enterica]|nr:hypothetical protein [Salmonella enterica subsp. enterica]